MVSLALALGLASMSGKNLTIGSLFIDEGFGNLDKDSLKLVMMTLSNLENVQGRKVGVISHTTQIRSQISPQIRLTYRRFAFGNRGALITAGSVGRQNRYFCFFQTIPPE